MTCGLTCLKNYCISIGSLLLLVSLTGLGFCLFLLFADPVSELTQHTSTGPNWENLGPAFIAAIISLLANLCLIGGAKQFSKEIVLFWIVWKFLLLIIFWTWYTFSQLKFHGYIDWMSYGMRRCFWCSQKEAKYVGYGGALSSIGLIILIIPVIKFHIKLKRHLREMTQSMSQYDFAPVMYNTPHQLQQQYNTPHQLQQQYNTPHQLQQQYNNPHQLQHQYNDPYKY